MTRFEYKTQNLSSCTEYDDGPLQRLLEEWGNDGWEVFSIIVPRSSNWNTFRVTAKRPIVQLRQLSGRKFR